MYSCFIGDFFNDSIPEAELYILSKILHDWDDDKCKQLLAKVYKACKPGRCELSKSRETFTIVLIGVYIIAKDPIKHHNEASEFQKHCLQSKISKIL